MTSRQSQEWISGKIFILKSGFTILIVVIISNAVGCYDMLYSVAHRKLSTCFLNVKKIAYNCRNVVKLLNKCCCDLLR